MTKIELRFENEEQAQEWLAGWLDGGGEQVIHCSTDYKKSDDWTKRTPKWLWIDVTPSDEIEV